MAKICVIGAGPAGSTFAARMAQLGHEVSIFERAVFPRAHLGESLSPGVLPLLEITGARAAVEAVGFPRVRDVWVKWEGDRQIRQDPRAQGLLVERGEFDRVLLDRARALGVRVRQPMPVVGYKVADGRCSIECAAERLDADFVADARGRCSGRRLRTGARTIAVYAYWRGRELPREPRIESGADAWYWGVPVPGGAYNTQVFVDVDHFRDAPPANLAARFLELLGRSGLMTGCRDAQMAGAVRATDATPWLTEEGVTPSTLRVGEAALALDPLSSSGVQKSLQTALAAAVVANTLLRKPDSAAAAMRFYRSNLQEASARHCRWAAEHYGKVAAQRGGTFWQRRAEGAPPNAPAAPAPPEPISATRFVLSRQAEVVELPCLDGDFVVVRPALRHPHLEGPVSWVAGQEIAPLLRRITAPSTLVQIARSWSVPLESGIAVARWLARHGILVPHESA